MDGRTDIRIDVPTDVHFRPLSLRAFTVAGLTAWNSLPDYLRDPSLSKDTFR